MLVVPKLPNTAMWRTPLINQADWKRIREVKFSEAPKVMEDA